MLSKTQQDKVKEFKKKHQKCIDKCGCSTGMFTMLETDTGIGPVDEIRCNECHKILDITDILKESGL